MPSLENAGPAGLNLLSATEAAARIAHGEITSEALVADCLARIEARDAELHAWTFLDPDLALAQARARDAETGPRGPLHGVPVGVKDVLDTADMPTEYGSAIFRGHRPAADSRCVAQLRAAGAVILGKTTTTEFASPVQVGVRNPHDLSRTPGVSSSGSAAAVADFMVPLANGTQTGGSVILPSAYCGLVGYKASLDGLDRAGIPGFKPTLDTLGLMARSVDDIALAWHASTGAALPGTQARPPARPPVGLCRTRLWDEAEPCARDAVETAARALAAAGYDIVDVDLPSELDDVADYFRVISAYECKQVLADVFRDHIGEMNDWMRDAGESAWTDGEYREASARAEAARGAMAGLYERFPLLLTPSTGGEAPADLDCQPDSTFNRLWTLMHGPTITLPVASGPNGMPVGVKLAARKDDDARLIGWARDIHEVLRERMT